MVTMNLFTKFGLFLAILFLFTGCHTIVFVNEESEEVVSDEIVEPPVEPTIAAQIFLDLAPIIFRELIFNSESHLHHLPPPVIQGHKGSEKNSTHSDNQRSAQTGSGSSDSNTHSGNRNDDGQNTRDSGVRRSGR
jgi:hypothetical protein